MEHTEKKIADMRLQPRIEYQTQQQNDQRTDAEKRDIKRQQIQDVQNRLDQAKLDNERMQETVRRLQKINEQQNRVYYRMATLMKHRELRGQQTGQWHQSNVQSLNNLDRIIQQATQGTHSSQEYAIQAAIPASEQIQQTILIIVRESIRSIGLQPNEFGFAENVEQDCLDLETDLKEGHWEKDEHRNMFREMCLLLANARLYHKLNCLFYSFGPSFDKFSDQQQKHLLLHWLLTASEKIGQKLGILSSLHNYPKIVKCYASLCQLEESVECASLAISLALYPTTINTNETNWFVLRELRSQIDQNPNLTVFDWNSNWVGHHNVYEIQNELQKAKFSSQTVAKFVAILHQIAAEVQCSQSAENREMMKLAAFQALFDHFIKKLKPKYFVSTTKLTEQQFLVIDILEQFATDLAAKFEFFLSEKRERNKQIRKTMAIWSTKKF
ncbi:hypothetical protein GPALN_003403 [Globodera pallida]|nr:hypothetical protein GPALN_003403 [Globodera pallida]